MAGTYAERLRRIEAGDAAAKRAERRTVRREHDEGSPYPARTAQATKLHRLGGREPPWRRVSALGSAGATSRPSGIAEPWPCELEDPNRRPSTSAQRSADARCKAVRRTPGHGDDVAQPRSRFLSAHLIPIGISGPVVHANSGMAKSSASIAYSAGSSARSRSRVAGRPGRGSAARDAFTDPCNGMPNLMPCS